ncbi:MAG: phosphoribosyltransferase family protein, partial [Myxococcota bacterium]
GKLPHKTLSERYTLEYGEDTLEIHTEDVNSQERVVVMDDLLATGGTASATIRLLKKLELQIVGFGCLIELAALKGRDRLEDVDIFNLLTY